MNVEYVKTSYGIIYITDENGKITKRSTNTMSSSEEVLMLENKIEIIDDNIHKIDEELSKAMKIIHVANRMIKFLPLATVAIYTVLSAIFELILNSFINIPYAIISSLFVIIVSGAAILDQQRNKKKAKENTRVLTSERKMLEDLKEKYKKELEMLNEKSLDSIFNLVDERELNKTISLVEKTNDKRLAIQNMLDNMSYDNINEKPNKLVLRRKDK